jgi:hypothetical protein
LLCAKIVEAEEKVLFTPREHEHAYNEHALSMIYVGELASFIELRLQVLMELSCEKISSTCSRKRMVDSLYLGQKKHERDDKKSNGIDYEA